MSDAEVEALKAAFLAGETYFARANGGTIKRIPCGQKRNHKQLDVSGPMERSEPVTEVDARLDLLVAQMDRESA